MQSWQLTGAHVHLFSFPFFFFTPSRGLLTSVYDTWYSVLKFPLWPQPVFPCYATRLVLKLMTAEIKGMREFCDRPFWLIRTPRIPGRQCIPVTSTTNRRRIMLVAWPGWVRRELCELGPAAPSRNNERVS
ncbi:hypothetical protein P170DRAFT_121859 [Aspergillus steynii IBT 23096]|uniref:Secreted protein n=1 Tax=Aspergillus steynii IBT 23096 TaxID=1392250 RepID=A0A2I2GJI6_9EURO|nr:uncharacterized protein P170DRAFT_121859 [Aspergillus steynii IBT 23096]PLB53036.1 hypothetical protein P170DRAFT_121859 [Aspergillus steynii IBT 23096]